ILSPFPDVWINEVLPDGPNAERWIELFNGGDSPLNLSGWTLSPDPGDLGRWSFPAGASMAPGGFLVVQANGQPAGGGGLAANFSLSPSAGSVVLARNHGGVPAAVGYLHYAGAGEGRS